MRNLTLKDHAALRDDADVVLPDFSARDTDLPKWPLDPVYLASLEPDEPDLMRVYPPEPAARYGDRRCTDYAVDGESALEESGGLLYGAWNVLKFIAFMSMLVGGLGFCMWWLMGGSWQ